MTTPYVDPQTIHDPAVGTSPPASWGTAVRDGLAFLVRPPGCKVQTSTSYPLSSADWTRVHYMGTDLRDTDDFHESTGSTPDEITIPPSLGGWYQVVVHAQFAANGTGLRAIRVQVNGSTVANTYVSAVGSGQQTRPVLVDETLLRAGDVVTIDVYQNSGSTIDLLGATAVLRLVALD